MKFNNRIFLRTNRDLREFLWFQQGADGSIYVGNSATKKITYGRKGKGYSPKSSEHGAYIDINKGDESTEIEYKAKLSFHQSGVVNLTSFTGGRRDRFISSNLSGLSGWYPLFGMVPMLPTRYPISKKSVSEKDVVIDAGLNSGFCIGIFLFIEFSDPKVESLRFIEELNLTVNVIRVPLFDRKLGFFIYYNSAFNGWHREQLKVVKNPEGGELPWPVIIPNY